MKHFIFAVTLACASGTASAQSWGYETGRATAPRAIAGDVSPGFEVVCYQGQWFMYLFGLPTAEGAAATILVDDQSFPVTIVYGDGSDGIELNGTILAALKTGNSVRVSSEFPSGAFSSTYTLRGSSRALNAVEAQCAHPTPATAPERFRSTVGESNPQAVALLRGLLAERLTRMRQESNEPNIDVQGASFIELEGGWTFIVADIGYSNYHFGFTQAGTTVYAKSPSGGWQEVLWLVSTATVSFDLHQASNGWPDVMLRNTRGVDPPYALWQWDGQQYNFVRRIEN